MRQPDLARRQVYDQLYLSNFALISVKDDLARLKGVGDVTFLGPRDYSMRIWLDPQKLASRGMTVGDVIKAIREQNVQVAAGRLGQPPVPRGRERAVPARRSRPRDGSSSDEQFDNIIVKTGDRRPATSCRKDVRDEHGRIVEKGIELGAKNYDVNSYLDGEPSVTLAVFQLPGSNALKTADEIKAKMKELKEKFPAGRRLQNRLRHDGLHRTNRSTKSTRPCSRRSSWSSSSCWSSCRTGAPRSCP